MRTFVFCAALVAAPLSAVAQQFTLDKDSTTGFAVNLNAGLKEAIFSHRLRVPLTPAEVLNAEFLTAAGAPIQFRMLADPDMGLIIGTPVVGLELELITRLDASGDVQYIVMGRRDGKPYNLQAGDLHLTNLRFKDFCFTMEPLEQAGIPLNIEFALDVSGSMSDVMDDMGRSLRSFVSALPAEAQCRATLFSDVYTDLVPPGQSMSGDATYSCNLLDDQHLLDAALVSGGGTNIVAPLTAMYQRLQRAQERLNLAVVISDGAGSETRYSPAFKQLQTVRDEAVEQSGVYTVVSWLGSFNQNFPLSDLADSSVVGPLADANAIRTFFARSEALLQAQRVVTPVSCGQP